jgi:hypothetical protein
MGTPDVGQLLTDIGWLAQGGTSMRTLISRAESLHH